ncbi:5'/3'-nucleotidase SurE [Roseomonas elaeocarpi]|uniref:5'-nucleotidase n=1 Tax=Roseomonas elaeocarpi TaxID=907779 RepID=A0ABV6JQ27_9PROT
MALNILLTNDDGYDAPGITTLYTALTAAGYNVHIVAPEVNQSAQGSTLGGIAALTQPIAYSEFADGNYYVSGSPVVTTKAGLEYIYPELLGENAPDLVISGTNRGENIGTSENISGTVNGAVAALFDGVPSIAVSAGADENGSYDAAFSNAATLVTDLLAKLEAQQAAGEPILPDGQSLSINVPGDHVINGVTVTTIDRESTAEYPISEQADGSYNSSYVPAAASSGNPLSEGAQFLEGNATITPIDGNWTSTLADRDALEQRLSGLIEQDTAAAAPLKIMLTNDDGYESPGLAAVRQHLLDAGYDVTVVAPSEGQSGVGTALARGAFTVTEYEAGYHVGTTPSTTVYTGLDALLTGDNTPDLIVSGTNLGANVGEQAVSSGTVSAAVAAIFNYDIPAIAVSTGTDSTGAVPAGLYDTSAEFVTQLIADLQATEGADGRLLPDGTGLNINVPVGATIDNYAFTVLDAATNSSFRIGAGATDGQLAFSLGGAVSTDNPYSEGNAFNNGQITVTSIDGNYASDSLGTYNEIANLLGTSLGASADGLAYYAGSRGDFHVTFGAGGTLSVTSSDGSTSETLSDIGTLHFAEGSLDARAASDGGIAVAQFYEGLLGRDAEAGGFQFWAEQYAAGTSINSIAGAITGSAEYAQTTGTQDNATFVTSLYEHLLNRQVDDGGLSFWTGLLDNGSSRSDVVQAVADSAEYHTNELPVLFTQLATLDNVWG